MANNENSYMYECQTCKASVGVTLAGNYAGVIKLYCHRCNRNMVKNQTPTEPPSPTVTNPVENIVTDGMAATGDSFKFPISQSQDTKADMTSSSQASPLITGLNKVASEELTRVSNYKIVQLIGRGAMGVIYLAETIDSKQMVALKLLSQDLQQNNMAVQRFLQEAKVQRMLNHPNIVRIYDVGFCTTTNRLYLAMEYVDGGSLEKILERGALSPRDSIKIAIAIGHALEHALQQNIVHRDLKPANILLDRKTRKIKVGDLGLGKIRDEKGITLTGEVMGTLYYMPPEQIKDSKQVDHRADIYALGATLYHMIAGRAPYCENKAPLAIIRAKATREPIAIEEYAKNLCPSLIRVVQKAMCRDVTKRYSTPTDMVQDLQKALQEQKA